MTRGDSDGDGDGEAGGATGDAGDAGAGSGGVERAVYLQRIDPDSREDYLAAHDDVPDGVTDAMARGGVRSFELYVRDDVAVCVLEADDVDAYLETIDGDGAVEAWERRVAAFKRAGVDVDADEPIPFMDRVWSYSPDDGDGA
jgi:L-rhamnose mutarotase